VPIPKLPDAELEVFACLTRLKEATAREIREAIRGYRPMAHGSVLTLLKRLEAKSLVTKRKGPVGKAHLYRPTQELSETSGRVVQNLVRRIFGGDSVALVASLFETQPPNREELAQLRRLLDEMDRQTEGEAP